MHIGESLVGQDANRAHINVVLGPKDGMAGQAFAAGLTAIRPGHLPFLVVLKPGVLTRPTTLLVNKIAIAGEVHGRLTWGAAQMGVAKAMFEALESGDLPPGAEAGWVAVVTVLVPADAGDDDTVFRNNLAATRQAIRNAVADRPTRAECRAALADLGNRFYKPGPSVLGG